MHFRDFGSSAYVAYQWAINDPSLCAELTNSFVPFDLKISGEPEQTDDNDTE